MKTLEEMIKDKVNAIESLQIRMNRYIRKTEREQREILRQVEVLKLRQTKEKDEKETVLNSYKPKYF